MLPVFGSTCFHKWTDWKEFAAAGRRLFGMSQFSTIDERIYQRTTFRRGRESNNSRPR